MPSSTWGPSVRPRRSHLHLEFGNINNRGDESLDLSGKGALTATAGEISLFFRTTARRSESRNGERPRSIRRRRRLGRSSQALSLRTHSEATALAAVPSLRLSVKCNLRHHSCLPGDSVGRARGPSYNLDHLISSLTIQKLTNFFMQLPTNFLEEENMEIELPPSLP